MQMTRRKGARGTMNTVISRSCLKPQTVFKEMIRPRGETGC